MHVQHCEKALLYSCLRMHLLLISSLLCFALTSYVLISIALVLV